ncbi:MAG: hypothetical protein H0T79_10435 [Deltaproteobacteria bacterium]|nr:hypothetical protein [Deltaproteobacteria bacterium]
MSDDARLAAMRTLVTDLYGRSDPRRQFLVAHAIEAADYACRLIERAGECSDAALMTDWHIAATGRDLYFDTKVTADAVRGQFGDRVEHMIAGLSDRVEQARFESHVRAIAEELSVARLSDVVDNLAICRERIDELDVRWVRDTFAPMVKNGLPIWTAPRFVRYPKIGGVLVKAIEHEHALLVDEIAAATQRDATNATSPRPRLTSADILVRNDERDHREGWLLRGMRVLFTLA